MLEFGKLLDNHRRRNPIDFRHELPTELEDTRGFIEDRLRRYGGRHSFRLLDDNEVEEACMVVWKRVRPNLAN
jgi:hypothetical protein